MREQNFSPNASVIEIHTLSIQFQASVHQMTLCVKMVDVFPIHGSVMVKTTVET